jgi:hypothetical protein
MNSNCKSCFSAVSTVLFCFTFVAAQINFKPKYSSSFVYAGIEIGSKGVKMSVVEIGKDAKNYGAFNIIKDTSVNTDFISFTQPTFQATLNSLSGLYFLATSDYKIPAKNIYTVVSSGVQIQAEKEGQVNSVNGLVSSFKLRINEPLRRVELIDVREESRLSHLGIIPEEKRYNTFLIDIGSGNTKGGYFPNGNTKDFKLFQITWGTKSVANAAEKRCDAYDKTLSNYNKQLARVLTGAENSEINYAINVSGAYNYNDNIAFCGGIPWAVATLLHPESIDKSVIKVNLDDVRKFGERVYTNYSSLNEVFLLKTIKVKEPDKPAIVKAITTVNKVFDQRSLMAGTALLVRLMRQFASVYESKEFYLIKNGQVGWVSAYVDQNIALGNANLNKPFAVSISKQ